MTRRSCTLTIGLYLALAACALAQETAPAATATPTPEPAAAETPSAPLPAPAITGPLQGLPPATFDAGPFGRIAVNGVVDGLAPGRGIPSRAITTRTRL
jgi:hypothetical protein